MGTVYLATDRNLAGRQVAIKENIETASFRQEQFQYEALLLSRLSHPNLPRVSDHFVEASGHQYLVMDYIDGVDLRTILHQYKEPPPEGLVLFWMDQVLFTLSYMHNWFDPLTQKPSPIIHRDIKPANIKRTPDGRIVLVDFGVAKIDETIEGTVIGAKATTAGYSPPEQYTGGTDARSDIYALGATLYTLLTNQKPPDATALAAGQKLISPRQLNPRISRATERTILKALSLNPADRFQSVEEMHASLPRYRQSDTTDPRTTPPLFETSFSTDRKTRFQAPKKRWLSWSLIAALTVLALLIVVLVALPGRLNDTWLTLLAPAPANSSTSIGANNQEALVSSPTPPDSASTATPAIVANAGITETEPVPPDVTLSDVTLSDGVAVDSSQSDGPLVEVIEVDLLPTETATPAPTVTPTEAPATASPTDMPAPATATALPTATANGRVTSAVAAVVATNTASVPTPLLIATNTPVPTPTAVPATAVPTPSPAPSATPTETATPTALPTATVTALPTATAPPPPTATNSPVPTNTLMPTDTPRPTSTPFNPVAGDVRTIGGVRFVYVPQGSFMMGNSDQQLQDALDLCVPLRPNGCQRAWYEDEQPQFAANTAAFWVMETETTNAQFQRFVDAGGYNVERYWTQNGWAWRNANGITAPDGWNDARASPDYPVVGISWYEAVAYARWFAETAGEAARLPTEVEWEKAGRGTTEAMFPWGSAWVRENLNFCDIGCERDWKDNAFDDGFLTTSPVRTYPGGRSPYGAYDMAGNVWEWVSTIYDTDRFPYPYQNDGREVLDDPAQPVDIQRSLRGGSWTNFALDLRVANRFSNVATLRNPSVGVRLVVPTQ
ncbi:MAG: SUMF1/EgtB/PvdO family nonheme iron enzyme, partial [Caldilineaceae bacterium]|nr:SUMF1/EgtB/PvdO family nonheme iron enzyme [Caldilineaceae bacterium]